MHNREYIQQITDLICNRIEDLVKSMMSAYLENGIGSKDNSLSVDTLTVDELASLLKVSKPVAYELANRDDFPSFKIGKSIRVSRQGLSEWILRQAAGQKGQEYAENCGFYK